MYQLFILVLMGSLIGWLSLRAFIHLGFRSFELDQEFFDKAFPDSLIKTEMEPLLDQQLDQLTEEFKGRHPMIGVFLTPQIADPFKRRGKEKILALTPNIKSQLIETLKRRHFKKKMEGYILRYQWVGIAIGALLGLIGGLTLWLLID